MDSPSQEKASRSSEPSRKDDAPGLPDSHSASAAGTGLPPVRLGSPPIIAGIQAQFGQCVEPPPVQLHQPAQSGTSARLRSRRSTSKWIWTAVVAVLLLFTAALGVAISKTMAISKTTAASNSAATQAETTESLAGHEQSDVAQPPASRRPVIGAISDQVVSPAGQLELVVEAHVPHNPAAVLRYRLLQGAELGAQINPRTGRLLWIPSAARAGGVYQFEVQVEEASPGGQSATRTFNVHVLGASATADQAAGGSPVPEPNLPNGQHGDERPAASQRPGQRPAEHGGDDPPPPSLGSPKPKTLSSDSPKPKGEPTAEQDSDAAGDQILVELYKSKKLLAKSEYGTIRRIYADRFQRRHQDAIRRGLGADYEKVMTWLDENRVFKEELYTAIDPQHDDIPAVMRIVAELIDKFPSKMLAYGELAIAVAVVWDQRRGIYDYDGHRNRARALQSPAPQLDAIGNFKYLLDTEKLMQGRGQYLPWEFLIHVVDHRTPEVERQWALANYLPRRAMIGTCYREVPYDYDLLDRNQPRLAGQQYTLPNIRAFGGVCAMQADFAARVAKSLGVPAAYVHGEAIQGDRHAWVMWVEVKSVTRDNIVFSLESHGRYRGDKYYVGHLHDPQTAQTITDRQLELRLHTVGIGPLAKRQAALVMRSFPMLREKLAMDVETQLAFINQVISLCPGNEEAWRAAARLSKEGQITESRQIKQIMQLIDRLFVTFAAMPDFTWELFDDLVAFQKNRKQFLSYYERLVMLYQQASRPDLACEARLKYTDYLVEDGKQREAIEGLAYTIKKFPEEGRYVPRLLDRLEAICKDFKGAEEHLVRLYQELLPLIPPDRSGRPSKYFMSMLERAAARFSQYNRPDLAQACQAQLARLRAMEAQRKNPGTQ